MATDTHGGEEMASVAEQSAGMPQLEFASFPNQIFWLIVTLVVLYLILSRVALPRIAGILGERQGTITNDLATAEDLKAKAAKADEDYNKALADARAEAQRIAGEERAKIQAKLDEAIAQADAEISERAAESEKAIADIRATAVDNVREVATATAEELVAALGGKADAAAVKAAVEDRMKG
ncbi:F0F1 ATP synthase subunit B' [Chachezhania antarctica]|uniref:F0F1 ATP synthase subunit B' n=1 Tax=Chachezhania antarctica TaxID=2340860 RepID=UPI000EAD5B89|nr:F0F1 ATP synthase subunit B' [Chachezhania antarctica]|tara:strand:- start:2529 stop:3071 length:543 start_codon:yes stop_codon:yes gene_type:complete